MRMLLIKQDSDLDAVSGLLLSARLNATQSGAAIEQLQSLNPHVDLRRLKAGTMLLVPEGPGFKISATSSVQGQALEGLREVLEKGLGAAAEKLKAGNAARAAERAEVNAVMRLAVVKRTIDSDADLKQQAADSIKTFREDDQQAEESERALGATTKAGLAKLAEIDKLIG